MQYFITKKLKVLCLITILVGTATIGNVANQNMQYHSHVADSLSPIEESMGWLDPSSGNSYGNIYSLDGKPMLQCLDLSTGENILEISSTADAKLYCATQRYFAPVIGYDYSAEDIADSVSYGMLAEKEIQDILSSNALFINQKAVQGDSIITTIYSPAQEEAVNQLDGLSGQENGDIGLGSIAVVNADGAILVNATAVPLNQIEFQNSESSYINNSQDEPSYYTVNNSAFQSAAVGSSFKPLTARILEQNDDLLSDYWSIYNQEFDDQSAVTVKGLYITNWEMISNVDPSSYYTEFDGSVYHRTSNLESAFINSSNTYFLRHANELGLSKFQSLLNENLRLYDEYSIGGFTLDGLMPYVEERFESEEAYSVNLPYGNTAILSPVRLASAYNHALSGKFYLPFEIAQIRDPDGNVVFQFPVTEREEYNLNVDLSNDIIADGLSSTFLSYTSRDGVYYDTFDEFPNELLSSGRLLAKSGTAGVDSSNENRTMALTLLSKDKSQVICTAVIAVNNCQPDSISNMTLIYKLLRVIERLEVY
ncbi:MAG: hypothetical protein LUG91_00320 [Ruminococcus sp.]|nr:hypothetical protein [Ruminococcus sp.]